MTVDADRDAIAILRASLAGDEEGMAAILRNADLIAMINCVAELYDHGTRRGPNVPDEQLGRCLAAAEMFIASHEEGERRGEEIRDWIANHTITPEDWL